MGGPVELYKVNSVQEACTKRFVVHLLKFEIAFLCTVTKGHST